MFFRDNKNFYPTPDNLIQKMLSKIKITPKRILEPSAGKGDILDKLKEKYSTYSYCNVDLSAIEIDETLSATLLGKNYKIIDSDFLNFSGPDKFDLIIANPPFDNGVKHLLKAIDIIFRGQIIFLLNAENVKNPKTKIEQDLVRKLVDLNADIELIKNAFVDAERKTQVEVALISIIFDKNIEDDLFSDVEETEDFITPEIDEHGKEIISKHTIRDLVAEYNEILNTGNETIINYYKNSRKLKKYMYLGFESEDTRMAYDRGDLTEQLQNKINKFVSILRKDFWRKTLDLKEVKKRLTEKKQDEFEHILNDRCNMDFTENNIRQFVLNLIGSYEDTLADAVVEIFDKMTIKYYYRDVNYENNIHLFNGWKTNSAFKVKNKVIIPVIASYGNPFFGINGWQLDYMAERKLDDIDIVMNYFDGMSDYKSIGEAIREGFKNGQTRQLESTYFTITCYKQGTIHLTFKDEDILRRFNVVACKRKGWLPDSYGQKNYNSMDENEKNVVNSFEGKKHYEKNCGQNLFANKNLLQIAM
jgi:hypothetical protein